MIRSVLVAVDGSARAPGVFEAAVELADTFGAILYPFRAIFVPPEFPASAGGSLTDPLPAHLQEAAMEDLLRLRSRAPPITVGAPIVRFGQPWRAFLDAGDELKVDLIVLGSHGYHGVDRILGTTAARVVNLARRNVLVVHGPLGPGDPS
jgi:nucleotide-binding universal stress UspA family protein